MPKDMTNDQRDYACTKLRQLAKAKKDKLFERFEEKAPKTYPKNQLTVEEMFDLLKKNKVKLRKKFRHKQSYPYNLIDITNFFDFSPFIDEDGYENRRAFIEAQPDYVAALKELEEKARSVEAEIMLGSGSEALQLLRAFEKGE